MENERCCKCDGQLSDEYWLILYGEDGSEKKIFCGVAPVGGRHVAVYADKKCPARSKKPNARRHPPKVDRRSYPKLRRNVVFVGRKEFSMADIVVRRNGERFLMVMPKVSSIKAGM